jgi:hypothetical protein
MEFDIAQYLNELTRYELLESYYLARGALVSDVTIFMTILFAYVTVAYFVSAKMTKFQAITISFLYSFFALYIASAAYNSSFILSKIGLVMSGVDSSSDSLVLVVLFLVTWIFSIILFIQTHRTRDD